MTRGLLVSFAGYPVMVSSFFPDNGLASLAGTLLSHGHEVKVLDFNTVSMVRRLVPPERTAELAALLPILRSDPNPEVFKKLFQIEAEMEESLARVTEEVAREIAEEVAKQRSHFVGFKLWSGHGFIASIQIAKTLRKQFPELKLFGGGPAVLYSEETIFDHTDAFDVLVHGEGEEAILGLADYAENKMDLSKVPNLILRDGGEQKRTERKWIDDLNTLAKPNYSPDVYPSISGDDKINLFILDESRGCPMGCAFCNHQDASGKSWRVKSPQRVIEEIQHLQTTHHSSAFRFGGSFTPPRFYQGFAEGLKQSGTKIQFCGFAHVEGIPADSLPALASVGCRAFFLGVESLYANDSVLLGKRLKPEKSKESIKKSIDAGIVPVVSLIVPTPGQTKEGLEENKKALVQLCRGTESTVVMTFPSLFPKTRWWYERSAFGFELLVEEREYMKRIATYKIRRIVPQSLWEPLPYKVDGKSFAEFTAVTGRFAKDLVENNIIVNVPDEEVLLSRIASEDIQSFSGRLQSLVFTYNAKEIGAFVAKINNIMRKN
jgi:hypothetical protein